MFVSGGALGCLGSATVGLVNPGDEVVVFEPCFAMYIDHIELSGGNIKTVPL